MSIDRLDLRLDDGVKTPTSVLVCSNMTTDVGMGLRDNERRVSIGSALYGDQYESFRLSPAARSRYLDAVQIVLWFQEHLRCRMGPEVIDHFDETMGEAKL